MLICRFGNPIKLPIRMDCRINSGNDEARVILSVRHHRA
jgi:hypothetical protein